MELKRPTLKCTILCFRQVLIAPLWNWNYNLILPLKFAYCSNCTFMELKLETLSFATICFFCSNCTFMELKQFRNKNILKRRYVLIAPLWNWNACKTLHTRRIITVLIAPLWNWNLVKNWAQQILYGSNCTFMELKLVTSRIMIIRIIEF